MLDNLLKTCPHCPHDRRGGVELTVDADNYSGCGVDICHCPECGRVYQVSYKIDNISEVENVRNSMQ
jgi:hypothetical protein